MLPRQVVLLTPPKSSHPTQFLSRQQSAPVSPLAATLMDLPASVANKRLTVRLNPLDATLTKNQGWGHSSTSGTHLPPRIQLSFQPLTRCPLCKSFLLICIHRMGGVYPLHTFFHQANSVCRRW